MPPSYLNRDSSKGAHIRLATTSLSLFLLFPTIIWNFDGYSTMDAHNSATLPTNSLSRHPATLTNAWKTIKPRAPQDSCSTISIDQPLFDRYHYILDNAKQGHEGMFAHSPTVTSRDSQTVLL